MINFLWLSLAIPILVHLVHRRRAKRIPFSTLRFLRMVDQRVARRQRLKELLLLALRLLLLAAPAWSFPSPDRMALLSGYVRADIDQGDYEMVPLVLHDPLEKELPDIGLAAFEDAETGEVMLFNTSSRRVRKAVAEQVERGWEERRRLFKRMKIDNVELSTQGDYIRPLVLFFKRRAARMAR